MLEFPLLPPFYFLWDISPQDGGTYVQDQCGPEGI